MIPLISFFGFGSYDYILLNKTKLVPNSTTYIKFAITSLLPEQ